MRECSYKCKQLKVSCPVEDCRMWIDYEEDLNCTLIAIDNNEGKPMTLREVAPRIGVSFPRVKQIEDEIFSKLKKKLHAHKN